jgi:hypothetical protein
MTSRSDQSKDATGLAGVLVHERQQQFHAVAVGGDGAGTGLALQDQSVGEEPLQGGRDQRHGRTADQWDACRAAASASSSGAADRYQ